MEEPHYLCIVTVLQIITRRIKPSVKYKKSQPCMFIGGLLYVSWLSSFALENALQGQYINSLLLISELFLFILLLYLFY